MKKKLKKVCGFFGCCSILLFSVLAYVPQVKEVKANDITIYYYDSYMSNQSQQTFVLYLLDAYTLDDNEGYVDSFILRDGQLTNILTHGAEFLRYSALDVGDYDAYIYNLVLANNEKAWGYFNVSNLGYSGITIPRTTIQNYYRDNEIFNNGYDIGHVEGVNDGKIIAYDSLEPGEAHYDAIFNTGKQVGETAQINTNFFIGIFEAFDAFFSIHLGNITIGAIILIPLSISLAWFIIKSFRGGGD